MKVLLRPSFCKNTESSCIFKTTFWSYIVITFRTKYVHDRLHLFLKGMFGNRFLFSCGDEWKVGRKFVVGSEFPQRVIVKKMRSLDLDHQREDLHET